MKHFSKLQLHEWFIYAILWIVVFAIPLIDNYYKYYIGFYSKLQWDDVKSIWISVLPFFGLFMIHNFWLLPHFLIKKKYVSYVLCTIMFLCLFSFVHELTVPMRFHLSSDNPPFERFEMNPPSRMFDEVPHHSMNKKLPRNEEYAPEPVPHKPFDSKFDKRPFPDDARHFVHDNNREFKRPFFIFAPYMLSIILAFLMLGLNIGIKYLIKSQHDEQIMKELEKHNLMQELEYLKYQINPHFFMNTLNNIHALIDIDAEKAKSTVIELSRLMRYVLYDSSHGNILLEKEIEFLKHYIALMKLRYCDKVKINISFPQQAEDISVPPLLFVSFVENAFKHGISYQSDSFIDISLKVENGRLIFICRNSKHDSNSDSASGIGLENVRKRLNLLFADEYKLDIENEDTIFVVKLEIPVKQ